jgi:NADPH-dependent ferric siderophore reductase
MGLPKWLAILVHGERRNVPRSPEAASALNRKYTVEQRLRRLEIDLEVHQGKPPARHR